MVPIETSNSDSHPDFTQNHPLDILRKRFFRGFTYNLNDPRSPSLHLNRTPLIFEDTLEQTLSLDDTFADLFVDPRQRENVNAIQQQDEIKTEETQDIEMPDVKEKFDISVKKEQLMASQVPPTPLILQKDLDPRSPSIGVERTPIIFTDDEVDEANEDVMLESILSSLSLNLNSSATSSVASLALQDPNSCFHDPNNSEITMSKPTNKHLDRVKGGKKNSTKGTHRKPKRRLSRQQVYEDFENQIPTTPKLKISQIENNDQMKGKRTPLGCVRNRNSMHVRSRSVESSVKSIKTRLALTSFDDTLNPSNKNIHKLAIAQQDLQNSPES